MIVIPEKQSHWYHPDGRTCFQVSRKDGKGMRDPTVRDARELGLLPSPTSILRVMAKPGLEAWKQEQAILAALTLPRLENEPLEAFAHRVVEDAEAQAGEAADFGRKIHKSIEQWLMTGSLKNLDPKIIPFTDAVRDWATAEIEMIWGIEKVVVNQAMGYAGTLDLHCCFREIGNAVVDFKSQGLKPGKAPKLYDEWAMQLAAYARAVHQPGQSMPTIVSVVINSTEPGPIHCEQWKDFERHWEAFCAAFTLWKYSKNYDPTQPKP